jgi:DNA-binding IclR family transcriptional regulator
MTGRRKAASPQKAKDVTYSAPALEKGLDVIELLARESEGLTRTQIARALDRTNSEIFRTLVCLEGRGYIAQGLEERFTLTLKLFQLAQEHPPLERLITDALPIMRSLTHETLQSCQLAVLEAGRVVIVAQVNAPTNIGFYVKLGSIVDLLESSSGYVLLAHQPPETQSRILEQWSQETGKPLPRDLGAHLARIRKTGYEKRASYLVKGILNVGFPIFDDRGTAIAALTVPFLQHAHATADSTQVIGAMRGAASELTRTIGGRSSSGGNA